ncbi:MAG: 4Fe-4S dicluster domain-containing protein [Gemmatimonadota bacterium]|nr:4Fe-4S dicluster domain-containing protein [Gemmatimonadota bacterium]
MTNDAESKGLKRRDFLKVVGGGAAVAASIGCTSDRVEKLIPYLVSPDNTVPGVATYYATTCRGCAAACGVIAETVDGRTIKLEGNPAHPLNRGALCAVGQAELQGLYNPDRYRQPLIRKNGKLVAAKWDEALQLLAQKLGEVRSRGSASGAAFINQHEDGSFPVFLDQWLADFGMPPHISYDAGVDSAAIAAHVAAYGVAWPRFDFTAASIVVSFGADFLDGWGPSVSQQLDWSDARAKLAGAPRLVYVGARRSLTGLNADTWLDCKPGTEAAIAHALAGDMPVAEAAQTCGVDATRLQSVVDEYRAAKPALVLAGGHVADSADLFTTVAKLNSSNGAMGATIRPDQAILGYEGIATGADLRALADRMVSGAVALVMVRGANPVYTMPRSTGFAQAFAKVPFKVSFASIMNDTSEMCDLILPDHHSLEQWGDAEPVRGTLSLQQPTMDPVFDSRATADVLITVAKGDPASAAKYAQANYRDWLISRFPGGSPALATALPTGIVAGTIAPRSALPAAVTTAAPAIASTTGDLFLHVYHHPVLGDGRGANKPWLQELPDPVTKITWQTVVEMHPLTAARMGLDNSDLVTVTTSAGKLTAPVYLYLGIRQDTVAVAAGRGHIEAGRYAKSGENAYNLLPAGGTGAVALVSTRASVAKAGGSILLATTEGSARQHLRDIARAMTVEELSAPAATRKEPEAEHLPGDASHEFLPGLRSPVANDAQGEFGDPSSNNKGMYDPNHWGNMAKRRWAMTVDLARCTGCAACVTACYAENNIPTVGGEWQIGQVMPDRTGFGANITRSREMAWIRLERYYEGGEDGSADFETRFIPMMCQHCGNAPCEPVCPVYATYHAPDGLNVQVYNRCVGTRYCSNNCPYKVRYFNWFGYGEPHRPQYAFPEPLNWQLNPDVTVRGKGVMEKCSMCVQRIRGAEHRAKLENRPVRPDEFTTACAEACPSRAITFGDASDESWSVTRLIKDERAYHVFEELNTFTAVVYLKKVNHPAPAAAPARA